LHYSDVNVRFTHLMYDQIIVTLTESVQTIVWTIVLTRLRCYKIFASFSQSNKFTGRKLILKRYLKTCTVCLSMLESYLKLLFKEKKKKNAIYINYCCKYRAYQ
jgi:hypothetical protein